MQQVFERVQAWCAKWVPDVKPNVAYQKVEEEFKEFLGDPSIEEAADSILALCAYAVAAGWDLPAMVDAKLLRNDTVDWIVQPNGTIRWKRD